MATISEIPKLTTIMNLKGKFLASTNCLEKELAENQELNNNICQQRNLYSKDAARPFKNYSMFDVDDKKTAG